jgi:aspartyl-tRNA(Asn)/glutamyl-tRNA(Gln) amidotransferase subunit A
VDPDRLAGGSSGGSAVAVASGMCWASLATDTRASSRVPAALCGVVGFKPTFGVIPTAGIVSLAWTMDHVAVITTSVADAAALFDVLVDGAPPRGSRRSADIAPPAPGFPVGGPARVPTGPPADLAGLRVGMPKAGLVGCDDDVLAAFDGAVASLAAAGADIVELDRPHEGDLEEANHLALLVSRCEAAAFHGARGTDLARCTDETADQLRAAGRVSAADYLTAQRLRRELAGQLAGAFDDAEVAVVALPTVPVVAPRAENPERYLLALSRNTSLWSLTGFPAISIPVPARHLPVGLQLVGLPYSDRALLGVAGRMEEIFRSQTRPPPKRKVRSTTTGRRSA